MVTFWQALMVNGWRMTSEALAYVTLGGLAIALIFSIYTDIRYRLIFNKITLPIALAAPLYWYATGGFSLTAIGVHLLTAAIVFFFFALAFRFGAMGGGDVKLFAALALWWPWIDVVRMILFASILGALVTIIFVLIHKLKQKDGRVRIPYGVAISLAGLWIAGERIFNHFT
jgi:prepilin peptidase CpaA